MPTHGKSRRTSREALARAALALIDELGLPGLTIRELSARAGVSPMTIYTYFKSKEQLQDALYAEVAKLLWTDSSHSHWQAELRAWCGHLYRLFVEHPRWRPLFFRRDFPAPGSLRERLLGLMLSDGFTIEQASSALMVAGLLSLGFAIIETDFRETDGSSAVSQHLQPVSQPSDGQALGLGVGECFTLAVERSILGLEATHKKAGLGPKA